MDENDFCAVVLYEHRTLVAYRVRHDDYCAVTLDCANKREAYALVAARWLDDNGIFIELALFLGTLDHVERRTGLDGASDVQTFVFNKNVCRAFGHNVIQLDKRRVSDGLKDVIVDHQSSPRYNKNLYRDILYKVFHTVADLYIFISKIVPLPSSLSHEITPFWELIICFASDKPIPLLLGSDFSP